MLFKDIHQVLKSVTQVGLNVRGLNTAATLWCTAAIGSLVGAGHPWHAAVGAGAILFTNFALRPLVFALQERIKTTSTEVETLYRITVLGPPDREGIIRAILMRHVNSVPKMSIQRSISLYGLSDVILTFDEDTDDYFARQIVFQRLSEVTYPTGVTPTLAPLSDGGMSHCMR